MQEGDVVEGKYRLQRLLGKGGMGAVWEVYHQFIGRRLAMKVLLPEHVSNDTVVARFIQEARAAAAIGSDHIVEVTDGGLLTDKSPYLVMEYLEGTDFASILRSAGPLEPSRAATLMLQVCEGVGAAHAQEIVHRDLKPENLFVITKRNGRDWVKVLDFGIAKFRDQQLTMSGAMLGTLTYMAPEQVGGAESVDNRADIYAMGVILYELLSGCAAIQGGTLHEIVNKIVMGDVPPLEGICPDLPPHLIWVVQRCLDREPANRFSSVDEMAGALRAFPFHAQGSSRPPTKVQDRDAPPRTTKPTVVTPPIPPKVTPAIRRTVVTQSEGGPGRGAQTISPDAAPEHTITDHAPKFALIQPGRFTMGSPSEEEGRWAAERPHEVVITRPFLMQSTPLTQAQWVALMGANPSRFQGAGQPVDSVSWFDAVVFCNLLSRRMGLREAYNISDLVGRPGSKGFSARVRWRGLANTGFRLPTEAEWEYAARAGTSGSRHGELDVVAWHKGNSRGRTHQVGLKRANDWLLHDCLGNVFEWCWDWSGVYHPGPEEDPTGPSKGESRVFRGGCFKSGRRGCRSAYRGQGVPAGESSMVGFRLARSVGK